MDLHHLPRHFDEAAADEQRVRSRRKERGRSHVSSEITSRQERHMLREGGEQYVYQLVIRTTLS